MRRIGDLLVEGESARTGERRVLEAAQNLAMRIMFLDVATAPDAYIQHRPTIRPDMRGLPADIRELGEYESNLLAKLIDPLFPVVCIEGVVGSGKSTTINYLVRHIVRRMACDDCPVHGRFAACKRLFAHIDFRKQPSMAPGGNHAAEPDRLVEMLCKELYARAGEVLGRDPEREYLQFWDYVIDEYDRYGAIEVAPVVRDLLSEGPWLREGVLPAQAEEIQRRARLREDLRKKDLGWYLNYQVLLWRYLIDTHFDGRPGCALVILDNLDTLATKLQRSLVDLVMRVSQRGGPTFVILLRPETRSRHGLADELVDVVKQAPLSPVDVVADRVNRFCGNPSPYLQHESGLTSEQSKVLADFLHSMRSRLAEDVFPAFLQAAAGSSIRQALLLAQGLCMVSLADMKKEMVTPHFLVRACITQGEPQFRASVKAPITNPFDLEGYEDGRFTLKWRILHYLARLDGKCPLSDVRTAFSLFGIPEASVKAALRDLVRNECQLVRSDGLDLLENTWGDEHDTLYLTDIGKGYLQHLILDANFVQEVMLDSRIDPSGWAKSVQFDRLTEKFLLLLAFVKEVNRADVAEAGLFIRRHGVRKYAELFGPRLLSLDLITAMYGAVGRILASRARSQFDRRLEFKDVLDRFTSFVTTAGNASRDLLGVNPPDVDLFSTEGW